MQRSKYAALLGDNKLGEHILPVFDVLEQYIGYEGECTVEMLNEVADLLSDQEFKGCISAIRKEAKECGAAILVTHIDSLYQNMRGYTKMIDRDQQTRETKLNKILGSYANISRLVVNYRMIANQCEQAVQEGRKIILALGLVNPEIKEDIWQINAEIDNMLDLFRHSPEFLVIPVYGCTTNVFATLMQKLPATEIHVAGHGCENSKKQVILQFTDSNMIFDRFLKKIGCKDPENAVHRELICLNCCHSYKFVDKKMIPETDYTIVHDDTVDGEVAFNFCESFYRELLQTKDVKAAWDTAKYQETSLQYRLLCSENT